MDRSRITTALFGAVLAACGDPAPPPAPPPAPVRVALVTLESRPPRVEVTAPVRAERRATLRAETAGRVTDAPFRAGASVSEGEVLVRLGVPRTAIGVSQARARVSQTQASLRQATRARADAEALAAQGANTSNAVEQARDREAEARARVAEAEAGLRAARAGLSESVLRAPFDGVLADFRVNVGEYLGPGAEVAILVDRSSLEAELLLDPVEARATTAQSEVMVRTTGPGAQTFIGRVTFVGEVLDPRSRRLPVRVAIDDPEGVLRPGEVATFDVPVGASRDVVLLPERAITRRVGRTQVFVVADGVATARDVRLGDVRGGEAEILEGLRASENVVVGGVDRVVSGATVRVVEDEAVEAVPEPAAESPGAAAPAGPDS